MDECPDYTEEIMIYICDFLALSEVNNLVKLRNYASIQF